MQENKENPNELLELLLEKCDRLYQENMLLKGKLEDRTDVDALKSSYEKTLSEKDTRIVDLEKQVAYLRRRIWGKSSERYIQADPQQRRIDFDGLDLLPGEIVLPGSKNTVKMGIGVQQNREQEYSKNGNKNTVISINIINQGLHCIINKKQDCDGLKNKITYHYVSRDSQAS